MITCDVSEGGDILLDMENVADVVFDRTTVRRRSIGLNLNSFVKRRSWVPSIPPSIRLTRQTIGQRMPALYCQPRRDHRQGHRPRRPRLCLICQQLH